MTAATPTQDPIGAAIDRVQPDYEGCLLVFCAEPLPPPIKCFKLQSSLVGLG